MSQPDPIFADLEFLFLCKSRKKVVVARYHMHRTACDAFDKRFTPLHVPAVDQKIDLDVYKRQRQNNITRFVVHAPYIINLANTVKPEVFSLAVEFLAGKRAGSSEKYRACTRAGCFGA